MAAGHLQGDRQLASGMDDSLSSSAMRGAPDLDLDPAQQQLELTAKQSSEGDVNGNDSLLGTVSYLSSSDLAMLGQDGRTPDTDGERGVSPNLQPGCSGAAVCYVPPSKKRQSTVIAAWEISITVTTLLTPITFILCVSLFILANIALPGFFAGLGFIYGCFALAGVISGSVLATGGIISALLAIFPPQPSLAEDPPQSKVVTNSHFARLSAEGAIDHELRPVPQPKMYCSQPFAHHVILLGAKNDGELGSSHGNIV